MINPFYLPDKDPELYHEREVQRAKEEMERKDRQLIPIQERHNYDSYHHPSVLGEIRYEDSKELLALPSTAPKYSFPSKKETIREFIQRKREILLVKKSIQNKKERTKYLEEIIQAEEETHKSNVKMLEDNMGIVDKYEDNLKIEAEKKAQEAQAKTNERISKQTRINDLANDIEMKNGLFDRKNEELKQLEEYKKFIDELTPPEFIQKPSDPKDPTFLTEQDTPQLFFKSPWQLIARIKSLEEENVNLIQHGQEAETELEALRLKNEIKKDELNKKLEQIAININRLKSEKQKLKERIKALSADKEENFLVDERTMMKIREQIFQLYQEIGGDASNNPTDLDMLLEIENKLEQLLRKKNLLSEKELKQIEKDIDKVRRSEKVEQERLKNLEKLKEINEKLEMRKKRVVKKVGRPQMTRSKLPEKVEKKVAPTIPQEVKDWKEFLEEDKNIPS
ncbi:unnamed protein product [Blepharisma stoltei]|uniref:DUF4200 domain-containing protein n=1 Tax=Blepharisma stoltei TaxID=1481888 RepID=A0AAU9JRX7_9CILI|nr:unnamed protein product [Blepharisma stoltei]